jgi:hypothetical protein
MGNYILAVQNISPKEDNSLRILTYNKELVKNTKKNIEKLTIKSALNSNKII